MGATAATAACSCWPHAAALPCRTSLVYSRPPTLCQHFFPLSSYDIVKGDESPLQIYVSSGDNRNVRLQTQLVAHRLNRLNSTGEDQQQRNMRRQIRGAMLQALHDLPMRDEVSVLTYSLCFLYTRGINQGYSL